MMPVGSHPFWHGERENMTSNGLSGRAALSAPEPARADGPPLSRRQKLRLVVKVIELRLRFIALMALTGLVFAYWDTIWNRYDKWMRPAAERQPSVADVEFYCPMHPAVVQDEPGACPICGMPLARRKKGEKATLRAGVTARVQLAPLQVSQAGITTAEVAYAPLAQTLTTVGYVAFDERRMANVVSRVPGKSRVETLYVNFTGQDVEAGEPLAELYSPELNQAIAELLTSAARAKQAAAQPPNAAAGSLLADWHELVRASAEKLKRWGITQPQIDEILEKGKTDFKVTILSPVRGHVFKKNVVAGQEVQEGYPMFEIVDLQTVWVQAQVYEQQLGLVHEGQSVEAVVDAFPGETFSGKVEFKQPHLDTATRTVEVRYSLNNTSHRLRPGMFATVTLKTPIAETPSFRTHVAAQPHSGGAGLPVSLTAHEQKICPVTSAKLGSMGDPIPVNVDGRKVWTCCSQCPPKLKAQTAKYLARLAPPPQGQVLSVPESAVIDTGARKIVYIESEPGVFDGRQVVLGPRIGDRFPVLEGLAPGERVAVDGAFLIDAESRINPGAVPVAPGGAPKAADAPARTDSIPAAGGHRH
jgi:Cu(I)/Ag(I) efflux system membrane fusion protein